MAASGEGFGLFWQSNNGDRKYNAGSLERWLKHFFTSGVFTGELQVTANSGMTVTVGTGYTNVDGKVKIFDTATNITLAPPNSTYPRIDTIVVERNDSDREIIVKKVNGEYSSSAPVPTPPVRSGGIYQLVLAQIYVDAGTSAITQADITDTRSDPDICGIVTGTVTEMDFSQFAAQFASYYENFQQTYEADFDEWSDAQRAAFALWMTDTQEDFDAWYAAIQEALHRLPPDSAEYLQLEIDELRTSGVQTWNGRSGSVLPMAGDYNASMISYNINGSAIPVSGILDKHFFIDKTSTPLSFSTVGNTVQAIVSDARVTANSFCYVCFTDACIQAAASANVVVDSASGSIVFTADSTPSADLYCLIEVTNQ